jgi:diguanylate cyclase (GGDEF)-like protein
MDSKEYAEKLKLLSGMAMLLQSCVEEKELFDVTYLYMPKLFPGTKGSIYLTYEPNNNLVAAFSWPVQDDMLKGPDFISCPAFLNGITVDILEHSNSVCKECSCGSHCIPFQDGKNLFGVFCLNLMETAPVKLPYKGLAFITAEYLSLAISNIRLKKRLQEMTVQDPLTKLYNRRYMDDIVCHEIKRAKRAGTTLGMIMVDLDHFKRFNDNYGHDAGDEVLRKVASVLLAGLRSEDIVCRFGGEEFFILIPTGGYEDYIRRAKELRKNIKALDIIWNGSHIGPLSASFGVAAFPDHGLTFDDVLKKADAALYLAKERGRDQVVGSI